MEEETNYYELLGVEITASEKEIKNAYRRKALKVHPDKNPSPDAAKLFHALTQAQDLLLDPKKRSEYDQRHRARQEQLKKKKEMDSKRRQAQEDLERREKEAKRAKTDQDQAKAQYEAELARLREEGAKRRQENWATENNKPTEPETSAENELGAVKFKWKRKKYDFSEQDLYDLLNSIAEVDSLALSEKKKGSAIVIFKTVVDAYSIITKKDTDPTLSKFESIYWATGKPPALVEKMIKAEELKKEAQAALYGTHSRLTTATGKPLFSIVSQSSFFKNLSNIPAFQVLKSLKI
ncbi:uncharacterized protein BX663DRAFT_532027 [Cokeromyces recurvatus]|uniref:uncharacterized protein n=1 Tax=Cokeromyces recurvatus TaxID=90255 RepID=UPI00221E4ECC|nr:uncharacterized protein BX663DRAFT_532027 [Cokeromyces recurvatus]KAI7901285.1 hypothetical protein BX663DRAFT_532027 [Cokeromyces recurvatus]